MLTPVPTLPVISATLTIQTMRHVPALASNWMSPPRPHPQTWHQRWHQDIQPRPGLASNLYFHHPSLSCIFSVSARKRWIIHYIAQKAEMWIYKEMADTVTASCQSQPLLYFCLSLFYSLPLKTQLHFLRSIMMNYSWFFRDCLWTLSTTPANNSINTPIHVLQSQTKGSIKSVLLKISCIEWIMATFTWLRRLHSC